DEHAAFFRNRAVHLAGVCTLRSQRRKLARSAELGERIAALVFWRPAFDRAQSRRNFPRDRADVREHGAAGRGAIRAPQFARAKLARDVWGGARRRRTLARRARARGPRGAKPRPDRRSEAAPRATSGLNLAELLSVR